MEYGGSANSGHNTVSNIGLGNGLVTWDSAEISTGGGLQRLNTYGHVPATNITKLEFNGDFQIGTFFRLYKRK